MVTKEEEGLGLGEEPEERLEPTAPPPPAYEDVLAEDEERERRRRERREPGSNVPRPTDDCQCQDKLITPHEPWRTDRLGTLVDDHSDPKKSKRKRQRKVKKVLGWTFCVACFPLAVIANLARDSPQDPDDPLDWNNDPLRPWNYKVNLDTKLHR